MEQLGSLQAHVVDEGGDGPVAVLLHGFGAPGDDLVPLAEELDAGGVRYVFPEAPLELDGGFGDARAWWMIDLERVQRDLSSGRHSDRDDELPAGLAEARAAVLSLLDAVEARFGVTGDQIVLGGFSQGAMLACDVALRRPGPLAALALMSGTLIARAEWAPRLAARAGLPVLHSHGREDPLLPFAAAERLRDLLAGAGLAVDWIPFSGGHGIPPVVLDRLGALLRSRGAGGG